MLALWYFLRRVLKTTLLVALFAGWIPLALVFVGTVMSEEEKSYLALSGGILVCATFYVLRLLIWLRPKTAAWLGRWALGDLSILRQSLVEGLPKSTGLSPSGQLYAEEHWVYEVGHPRRDVRFWQAEKERLKTEFDQEEIWIMQYEGRRI